MKKKFIAILTCVLFILGSTFAFAGVEVDVDNQTVMSSDLFVRNVHVKAYEDYHPGGLKSTIMYQRVLVFQGNTYNLFPAYVNPEAAMMEAQENYAPLLEEMRDKFDLPELGNSTWKRYKNCIEEMKAIAVGDSTLMELCYDLEGFFDIYENTEENAAIEQQVNRINSLMKSKNITMNSTLDQGSKEELSVLRDMLPHNTGALEAVQNRLYPVGAEINAYYANADFNASAGIAYANKFANSITNAKYGYIEDADCTNFASQIKHEGGVKTYLTINDGAGWTWNRIEKPSGGEVFDYTSRWVSANAFVNFFGVKSKYASSSYSNRYNAFVNLSKNVKAGSFISYDKENDGDWNHMGFVTGVSSTEVAYHELKYRDFKVAQHTDEYNQYVSGSDNGWDNLQRNNSSVVVFAIVN